MERLFIDSWAWIEYFAGSSKGKAVHEAITHSNTQIFTSIINQYEVFVKLLRLRDKAYAQQALDFMKDNSNIGHLNREIIERAGEFKVRNNLGMADSIVAASAEKHNATILTGDPNFKGFKEAKVRML